MGGYDGVEAGVLSLGGSRLVIEVLRVGVAYQPGGPVSFAHSPGPIAPGGLRACPPLTST